MLLEAIYVSFQKLIWGALGSLTDKIENRPRNRPSAWKVPLLIYFAVVFSLSAIALAVVFVMGK